MWLDDLKKHIAEEEHDKEEYCSLADAAEEEDPTAAGILRDIAHEECIHKKLLEEILAEHNSKI